MFEGKTLSLIFPAKDEEENIKNAINSFRDLKIFDELIVVDNNSSDKTSEISVKNGAKVVKENNPGYGFALRKGLREASGEYIVICEPDGTFSAKDSLRLLKHIHNYDLVAGTRTNPKFINKNSNMGFALRIGNIAVAKFMQILFFLPKISDCGCTFRIIKKEQVKKMNSRFTVGKSHFLPELVILNKINEGTMIEVPVHYSKRIGKSKITGSKIKSVQVGYRMLLLILSYRLNLVKRN